MRPLEDVRILAVEQYGAGPWATMHLTDLGAEVIKIEDPQSGGDIGRYVPPFQSGDDSLFFQTFNRNKKSIALDLRLDAGREVFRDLVRNSDGLFCNLRADIPRALGLTYEQLRPINPRIVCCSLTGFGMTGPRAEDPGYDYTVQALAGWMSVTGDPDGPPTKSGLSLVDWSGGYAAAIALLAGLWRARRDGIGCDCDVSLFETALQELSYVGTWTASRAYEASRLADSAHPSIVPFQAFPTADRWMVVACPKEKFWQRLCVAIGAPDLLQDERFASFDGRLTHRDEVVTRLRSIFVRQSAESWISQLQAAGVPCAPVQGVEEAIADPQVAARGGVIETDHPVFGTVRVARSPLRVGKDEMAQLYSPAPGLGEDTEELLKRVCSYSNEQIATIRSQNAFGIEGVGERA
jgi:crotonobetainyl-CoA:carnitine CoA-transferase CaiB-like acyl-CoA transferase